MITTKYHRLDAIELTTLIEQGMLKLDGHAITLPFDKTEVIRLQTLAGDSRDISELINATKHLFETEPLHIFPVIEGKLRRIFKEDNRDDLEKRLYNAIETEIDELKNRGITLEKEIEIQKNRYILSCPEDCAEGSKVFYSHGLKDINNKLLGVIGVVIPKGTAPREYDDKIGFVRRVIRNRFAEQVKYTFNRLTGFYTKEYFDDVIPNLINSVISSNPNTPLTGFVMDISRLKKVNDYESDQKGDEYLRFMADIIREEMPVNAFIARGNKADEIYTFLIGCTENKAEEIQKRIQDRIKDKGPLTLYNNRKKETMRFEPGLYTGSCTTYSPLSRDFQKGMPRDKSTLFALAHNRMNADKDRTYQEKGWNRRQG